MGKRLYRLKITKQVNYEQIVKAVNKKEALKLFDEEDLYDRDSKIIGDISIEEYYYGDDSGYINLMLISPLPS